MSYSKRLLEVSKRKWKSKRILPRVRRPVLFSDGPYRAICFTTPEADLLCILHYFAGGTTITSVLPVGLVADLDARSLEQVCMSYLRKIAPSGNGKPAAAQPPSELAHEYPALVEYLFCEAYPDGSRRQRSTLTVMAGDATGLKCVLNDREEGRSLWATGQDLGEMLVALEVMLEQQDCPWRLDKQTFRAKKASG